MISNLNLPLKCIATPLSSHVRLVVHVDLDLARAKSGTDFGDPTSQVDKFGAEPTATLCTDAYPKNAIAPNQPLIAPVMLLGRNTHTVPTMVMMEQTTINAQFRIFSFRPI